MISLILNLTKKYIYIFILILIPCLIFSNKLFATENNFLVEDLEISEEFDLNFSKNKVIEKAFSKGFENLLFTILTSKDLPKVNNVNINEIKQLVENFKIKGEKFKDEKYIANFDINFNNLISFSDINNESLACYGAVKILTEGFASEAIAIPNKSQKDKSGFFARIFNIFN